MEDDCVPVNMINFFRQLSDDMESNNINMDDLFMAGEVYRLFKYKDEVIEKGVVFEDAQLEKYLFAGWYFYYHCTPELNHMSSTSISRSEESEPPNTKPMSSDT